MADEPTVSEIYARLVALENKMFNGALSAIEKNSAGVSKVQEQLTSLERILVGDPQLKVRPLRDEVAALRESVDMLNKTHERIKWVAIGLGATNVGGIITFVATLLGGR